MTIGQVIRLQIYIDFSKTPYILKYCLKIKCSNTRILEIFKTNNIWIKGQPCSSYQVVLSDYLYCREFDPHRVLHRWSLMLLSILTIQIMDVMNLFPYTIIMKSFRVSRLLSSSLLLHSQNFILCLQLSSGVSNQTQEPTENFEPCPLLNPLTITRYKC